MAGHRFSANIAKLPELLSKPKRNVRSREKRTSSGHRKSVARDPEQTFQRHPRDDVLATVIGFNTSQTG